MGGRAGAPAAGRRGGVWRLVGARCAGWGTQGAREGRPLPPPQAPPQMRGLADPPKGVLPQKCCGGPPEIRRPTHIHTKVKNKLDCVQALSFKMAS